MSLLVFVTSRGPTTHCHSGVFLRFNVDLGRHLKCLVASILNIARHSTGPDLPVELGLVCRCRPRNTSSASFTSVMSWFTARWAVANCCLIGSFWSDSLRGFGFRFWMDDLPDGGHGPSTSLNQKVPWKTNTILSLLVALPLRGVLKGDFWEPMSICNSSCHKPSLLYRFGGHRYQVRGHRY